MSCIVLLARAGAIILATATISASATPAPPNSVRMAEYLYYSIPKSGLLADWLDSIKMSPARRADLKEFTDDQKQKKAKVPSIVSDKAKSDKCQYERNKKRYKPI